MKWTHEIKTFRLHIFKKKYVVPKSLKVGHWLSETPHGWYGIFFDNDVGSGFAVNFRNLL